MKKANMTEKRGILFRVGQRVLEFLGRQELGGAAPGSTGPVSAPTTPSLELQKKAFQAAIAEDPTDVTTRLVFADWLEDNVSPYEASYQRWVGFMMSRGDWPPVIVLASVPFLHLSDLVKLNLNKLPAPISILFLRDWQGRQLLAPWEVETTICQAFLHERFIFSAEQGESTR